jgi:hypothetical protein
MGRRYHGGQESHSSFLWKHYPVRHLQNNDFHARPLLVPVSGSSSQTDAEFSHIPLFLPLACS